MLDGPGLLAVIARVQRSGMLRWLLGLRGFSVVSTRPGGNPIERLKVRLLTTLEGLVSLAVTVVGLAMAGVVWAVAGSPRPACVVLMVSGTAALVVAVRALWRSRRAGLPDPGVLYLAAGLNLLAAVGIGIGLVLGRAG